MSIYIIYNIFFFIQNIALSKYYSCMVHKRILLFLGCLELIVLMSLRHFDVGADTFTYVSALFDYSEYRLFDLLSINYMYPYNFELGYLWLTKICAFFNFDYNLFLFIIASLIYIPVFKLIYRFSPFPVLSISMYFGLGLFAYSIGIFRQFIAISVIISGIDYIINKELAKWCITVLLAMSFHTSALICLPMYLLSHNFGKWFYLASIIFQLILNQFGRSILEIVFGFFLRYAGNINSDYDITGGSYVMLAIYNIIFFVVILYKRFFRKDKSKYITLFCNFVPIVCCLQILGYHLGIFGRIVPYYSIFLIILIPVILKDMFNNYSSITINYLLSFIFILLFIYRTLNDKYITPFVFFWDK